MKYHNGNPFTADDVVFSIQRAKHENSDMKGLLTSVVEVVQGRRAHRARMRTDGPNPLLPNNPDQPLHHGPRWSEANKVMLPQNQSRRRDLRGAQCQRHRSLPAGGSGEPDVRTELERNEDYTGWTYPMEVGRWCSPGALGRHLVAAPLGEVDFSPRPAGAGTSSAVRGKEYRGALRAENRTIFLGMNQGAAESRSADVKCGTFADKESARGDEHRGSTATR